MLILFVSIRSLVAVAVVAVAVAQHHCISYAIHLLTTKLTKIGNTIYPIRCDSSFEKQMVTLLLLLLLLSQMQP
jgi:hypothetical protein